MSKLPTKNIRKYYKDFGNNSGQCEFQGSEGG